jgi:hypothetical protein
VIKDGIAKFVSATEWVDNLDYKTARYARGSRRSRKILKDAKPPIDDGAAYLHVAAECWRRDYCNAQNSFACIPH